MILSRAVFFCITSAAKMMFHFFHLPPPPPYKFDGFSEPSRWPGGYAHFVCYENVNYVQLLLSYTWKIQSESCAGHSLSCRPWAVQHTITQLAGKASHETVLLNFAIDWAKSPMTASAKVAITTIRLGIARTASMGNDLQLDLELHKRHAECTKNNNMGNDLRIWTGTCLE